MIAAPPPGLFGRWLAVLGGLALLLPAGVGRAQDELPPLSELLEVVRSEEDRTPSQVFARIVQHGNAESLKTVRLALRSLRSPYALARAYGACLGYAQVEDLRADAIAFLREDALRHNRDENRVAAARALAGFGELALDELEAVFRRSRSPEVTSIVAQPLVPRWGAEGTPDAAQRILDHALIRREPARQQAREALAACRGEKVDALVARALRDADTPPEWRLLLVELVAERPGRRMRKALLGALDDPLAEVRLRALELLGETGDPSVARHLRPHLRAEGDAELRQAVVSIGKLVAADPDWADELVELARSPRPGARLGAAVALLELRTLEAVEALHALLADPDWRVRAEALQQVGNLRSARSIPSLIARLDAERGRLRRDLATVLRLITGEDHGESRRRWEAWWADAADAFELPAYEQALAAEQERRTRRAQNLTLSSFYGLDVVSERVCFVVDTSGSMRTAAGNTWRTSTEGETGPTRLEVARQELERALKGLLDGVLFNVVFFHGSVHSWMDELTAKDEETLGEVLGFSARQQPAGSTNLFGGLMRAFEDPRVDTIFLLSDGDPSSGPLIEPAAIRERVARHNRLRKVQIHCIAIGQPSSLLRALAAESGGEYVESK